MLPPRSDPRWKALVIGSERLALKGLATKLVMTRVRLMGARKDQKSLEDAIDMVFEYFSKNLEAASDDIRTLFGGKGSTP